MLSELKKKHPKFPSINGILQDEQNLSETDKSYISKQLYFTSDKKNKAENVANLKMKVDQLQILLIDVTKDNQMLLKLNRALTDTLKCVNEDIEKIFEVKGDEDDEKLSMENKPHEILERIKLLQEKMEMQATQKQIDSPRFKRLYHFRDKTSPISYTNSCQHFIEKVDDDNRTNRNYPKITIPNERKSSIDYIKRNDIQTKKILTYNNTPVIPDNVSCVTNQTKDKRVNYNQSGLLSVKSKQKRVQNNCYEEVYKQLSPYENITLQNENMQLSLQSKMWRTGNFNTTLNSTNLQKISKSPRKFKHQNFEKKLGNYNSCNQLKNNSIEQIWERAQPRLKRQKSSDLIDSYLDINAYRQLQKSPRKFQEQQSSQFHRNYNEYTRLDSKGKSYLHYQPELKLKLTEDISFSNRSYLNVNSPRIMNNRNLSMKPPRRMFY